MKKFGITLVLLCVLVIMYLVAVSTYYPDMSMRGQFGDMFGGINALFSGLAFLGIIYTILLQKEELSLQRKELELTRKELKRTAEAQERSEVALSRQAESLKQTAKLNGLSSLLQRCMTQRDVGIARYGQGGVDKNWDQKAEEIANQIEDIINQK